MTMAGDSEVVQFDPDTLFGFGTDRIALRDRKVRCHLIFVKILLLISAAIPCVLLRGQDDPVQLEISRRKIPNQLLQFSESLVPAAQKEESAVFLSPSLK